MQILAASGCIIEDNISYGGNDLTYSVVESIQECANFASQDEAKGTMGTLGWVFYPDSGNCRPQKTVVGNSNSQAVSGTLDCGKGKFKIFFIFGEGKNSKRLLTCLRDAFPYQKSCFIKL